MIRPYPNLTINTYIFEIQSIHIFPYKSYKNNFYKMSLVTLFLLPSQTSTVDTLVGFLFFLYAKLEMISDSAIIQN